MRVDDRFEGWFWNPENWWFKKPINLDDPNDPKFRQLMLEAFRAGWLEAVLHAGAGTEG